VALDSALIPAKHGADGTLEFYCINLTDATRVDPKVSQAILLSQFCTESELIVALLVASCIVLGIVECNVLLPRGVQQDGIQRKRAVVVEKIRSKIESTGTITLQETHLREGP
jgi:hypothetical protein